MDDMKAMVLAFAANLARTTYDAVIPTVLETGMMEDKIDVGGVEWHVTAFYVREYDVIHVKGHPHREESDSPFPGPMRAMFGGPDRESFEFQLPASWLPQIPTTDDVPS